MRGSRGVRAYGPISRRRCGLAGEAVAKARPAYHRAGKRIGGRGHYHQERTIVKREYEPPEPGIEGRMDSRLRLDVGQDGRAEVKTVRPRTDDSDENCEKYRERCELFTPGANFRTVYADEEIDLLFAKIHVCKNDGIPCAVRDS